MKRPPHDGSEEDAFSKWRNYLCWRPGELRAIKRRASKRDRRQAKAEIRNGATD